MSEQIEAKLQLYFHISQRKNMNQYFCMDVLWWKVITSITC